MQSRQYEFLRAVEADFTPVAQPRSQELRAEDFYPSLAPRRRGRHRYRAVSSRLRIRALGRAVPRVGSLRRSDSFRGS